MFITELFNRAAKWQYDWNMSDRVRASFEIIDDDEQEFQYSVYFDGKYNVEIALGGPTESFKDVWDVTFSMTSHGEWEKDDITGTGNAIIVFSTVIEIIKDVTANWNIQNLTFSAAESSRSKLYHRMAKQFVGKGWRYIDDREIKARSDPDPQAYGSEPAKFLLTKQPHPHERKI